MKTILLHVRNDDGHEARLHSALALVKACDGHLVCVQTMNLSAFAVTDPFGGMSSIGPLYEIIQQENVDFRTQLEARLTAAGVAWDWHYLEGGNADTIVRESRLVDVVVLSLGEFHHGESVRPFALAADVALHVRGPVLAVPLMQETFDPNGTAMIAWNGSAECAHAMRAAIPMLHKAKAVKIFTTGAEAMWLGAADAARFLARHGITADVYTNGDDEQPAKLAILQAAEALAAAYIVMGAYGHSRFREAVLGGVTRHLINHSPVPLLVAH